MWFKYRLIHSFSIARTSAIKLIVVAPLFILTPLAHADQIKIAVASNFSPTLTLLSQSFEKQTGHDVVLISGSTGKLFAQIVNGAPYDAFFAADKKSVDRLVASEHSVADTAFTYAIGKLVAWNPQQEALVPDQDYLRSKAYRRLAIANPKLAPYGKAAQQVLQQLGLWDAVQPRLVRGENIGQAYHFVKSRNAQVGLIAYAQLKQSDNPQQGSWWNIPAHLYEPIDQQAVLLKDNQAARDFLNFCRSEWALKAIRNNGYHTPDADS